MLTFLMHIVLFSHGALCYEPEQTGSIYEGALNLPWQDELCCDSPTAHLTVKADGRHRIQSRRPVGNLSQSDPPRHPHCHFASARRKSHLQKSRDSPGEVCMDVTCRIDKGQTNVICDIKAGVLPPNTQSMGLITISLKRLVPQNINTGMEDVVAIVDYPAVCAAEESLMCSFTLNDTASFVAEVTISFSNATAPPVRLSIPTRPVKPSPPFNLTHTHTIEGQLILSWTGSSQLNTGQMSCEVRHTAKSSHPVWQAVYVSGESRVSLDLRPRLNYTIQARCSHLGQQPPLWSEWSQPHHIYLDTVSYIPDKVVVRPGENITVYCVFNDHSINASTAMWILNFEQKLTQTQHSQVNHWVSQITVRPSERRMYDLLQCTQAQQWNIPYSQIYVEGAAIDISCVTSGDIDAMTCSWKNLQWTNLDFIARWADLPCDVMEERERAGEEVGELGQATCQPGRGKDRVRSCTIQPLRMNCYKLWLEVHSPMGPIKSRPIYVTPTDHVKPHKPSNVKAVSQPSGMLTVMWEPPPLPVEGLQCQFRYHSTVRPQTDWKVQSPTRVTWAEVVVTDMCRVYVVQVRCMHTNGTGYWSDWSESVYSTPQNSRTPEHGPDFWRVLQDDPYRNQTNVTLLFKDLQVKGGSYCIDGFVVQHQTSRGAFPPEWVEQTASYSFEWSQEVHTVTVGAFNSLGTSTNNINMTLDRQPKRHCVRSFHVQVINNTCVSLSWNLADNTSVPIAMVVQWSAATGQDTGKQNSQSAETWARLPHTEETFYLRGDFFGPEQYGFTLYPVFADAEGEPVHTIASRGDPVAYMLLMTVTFLSIVLIVTLVLSQNQMKKFVLKDVPNPNHCSWAKELDFKKMDTLDHLFQLPEGLPAWPLLFPPEKISQAVIADKADIPDLTTALVQAPPISFSPDHVSLSPPAICLVPGLTPQLDQTKSDDIVGGGLSLIPTVGILVTSAPQLIDRQVDDSQPEDFPSTMESSAQSSVTYATVLLSEPEQDQPSLHVQYKEGSGSGSSDEGNFSANNSDISGSFPGGLWELESYRGGESDDPRRSCSYNSAEEFSETSGQEEDDGMREEKDLYYLELDYMSEEEEEEREQVEVGETKIVLLETAVLSRSDCCVESKPLLAPTDSNHPNEPASVSMGGFSSLYMPQFRTASCTENIPRL